VSDDGYGSDRPDAVPLDPATGQKLPLHAFSLLEQGDAFERFNAAPPKDGRAKAQAYVESKVIIESHGAGAEHVEAVKNELVAQLLGNPQLVARLAAARPITVDVVPENKTLAHYGFPKGASSRASGLFWDHPTWSRARIGFKLTALKNERALVTHEMAHAIQRLAFTQAEQDAVYRLMLPTYRYKSWVDEVFAIYSEREFHDGFSEREGHAPGVYGMARKRWDERHVFTRFVRSLYHPHKPLAGSTGPIPRGLLG
jgi:hypothetical protein